jgi:ABC-2 type transport system permease protein
MLAALMQVGLTMAGAGLVEKKKENIFNLFLKNLLFGLLGCLSLMISMLIQYFVFQTPYTGTLSGGIVLTFVFTTAVTALGILVGLIVPNRLFAVQVAAILVLPSSILGGYTWPLMAMPKGYQILGKYLPYTYYAESLRDLTVKNIGFDYIMKDLKWLICFAAVMWLLILTAGFVRKLFFLMFNKESKDSNLLELRQ